MPSKKEIKQRYRTARSLVAGVILRARRQGEKVFFCPSQNPIQRGRYLVTHPTENGIFKSMKVNK